MQLPLLDAASERPDPARRGDVAESAPAMPFAGLLGALGTPSSELEPVAAQSVELTSTDAAAQAMVAPAQLPLWPGWISAAEPQPAAALPPGPIAAAAVKVPAAAAARAGQSLVPEETLAALKASVPELASGDAALRSPASGSASAVAVLPAISMLESNPQPVLAAAQTVQVPQSVQLPELRVVADLEAAPPALPVVPSSAPAGLREVPTGMASLSTPAVTVADPGPISAAALPNQVVATLRQFGGHSGEARLQLHPAELGQLDLELKQSGTHLELSVTVDNEQSRRLVQEQLGQWRERLAETGMQLDALEVSVRDQSSRQDNDGLKDRATAGPPADVNNSAVSLLLEASEGLDLYA